MNSLLNSERKIFLFTLLLAIFAYQLTLRNDFSYDDFLVFVVNPFVWSWKNFPNLLNPSLYISKLWEIDLIGGCPIGSGECTYRPVGTAYYFVVTGLFGLVPFWWHLFGILMHATGGYLIHRFTKRITSDTSVGILAAALFVTHPINSGAVNCAAHNKECLALLFSMTTILLFNQAGFWKRVGSHLFFLLALFTKESALPLLAGIMIYDFFLISQGQLKRFISTFLPRYTYFILFFLFYLTVYNYMYLSVNLSFNDYHQALTPQAHQLHLLFRNLGVGLKWFLLPESVYPTVPITYNVNELKTWADPMMWVGILSICSGALIICRTAKKHPVIAFALMWFYVFLVPTYPLLRINYMVTRYFYFPSVGLCILFAWMLRKTDVLKLVLIPALALLTITNSFQWCDSNVFWEEVLRKQPHHFQGHLNLVAPSLDNKDFKQALFHAKRAIQYSLHRESSAYRGLAVYFYRRNDFYSSARFLKKALRLEPKSMVPLSTRTYNELGAVLVQLGRRQEAIFYFSQAIRITPYYLPPSLNLANLYLSSGEKEKALRVLAKLLAFYPGSPLIGDIIRNTRSEKPLYNTQLLI